VFILNIWYESEIKVSTITFQAQIDEKILKIQELVTSLEIQRQKIEEMIEVSDERSNSMIINMNHMLYCLLLYY
jgi:hypothetical protein